MTARTVVSLGGNALLPAHGPGRIAEQVRVTTQTMAQVVELLQDGEEIVVTHGNGPIVGNILIRNEAAARIIPPTPLDICGADSQGGIGYMIQQVLRNLLRRAAIDREVATIVTQMLVAADDPGFHEPTKPIGPFYSTDEARTLMRQRDWRMVEDSGRGWRRVVPSPEPLRLIELAPIRMLVDAGVIVIAAGGGGIPVIETADGALEGVEAVIDKDLGSVVLARAIGAQHLAIITAVDRVALDFGTPRQKDLELLSLEDARRHLDAGQFPAGSMGPKIRGAIRFLEGGGREVLITSPEQLVSGLAGKAGTRILP